MLDGDKFIEDPVPILQSVEKFLQIPSFYRDHHFTYNGELNMDVTMLHVRN